MRIVALIFLLRLMAEVMRYARHENENQEFDKKYPINFVFVRKTRTHPAKKNAKVSPRT